MAIGPDATSKNEKSVAIGENAIVSAAGATQIGPGENTVANSLKFHGTTVVGGDGKIPTPSLRDIPALESVPDRAILSATAYAVGDALGDAGKAYRCISAYTSTATPKAPSSDAVHWTEVPVLKATYDQLADKATKAYVTLNKRGPNKDGFSAWTIFREGVDVTVQVTEMPRWINEADGWLVQNTFAPGDSSSWDVVTAGQDALYLTWKHVYRGIDGVIDIVYTATRTALQGYQLGSQDDTPLQPAGNYVKAPIYDGNNHEFLDA